MSDGFTNKPKILRGAFVEYGLSIPPLVVVFQFNPVQLTRNRSLTYSPPNNTAASPPCPPAQGQSTQTQQERIIPASQLLRHYHQRTENLMTIRDNQVVTIEEESINFEIRLDATDKLNDGDTLTEQFGIAPQLSTLELMVHPKSESLIGTLLSLLSSQGFSFTRGNNPPMILFIWGRKKVLPVNIRSMNITETEFSTDLNPIRATVSVGLTVIEGKNIPYMYTKAMKEVMSVLNLANIADIANVVIPG
jgi:hypothetical protein